MQGRAGGERRRTGNEKFCVRLAVPRRISSRLRSGARVLRSAQQSELAATLERTPVSRTRMDAIEKGRQFRPARIQASTGRGGLERKAHLDICRRELVSRKPPMLAELGLQITQMLRNLRHDERVFGAAGNGPRDRPRKER